VAALVDEAVGGDAVPGGVEDVPAVVENNFWSGGGGGVAVEGFFQGGEPAGPHGGVVVHEGDEFVGGIADAAVDGGAETGVAVHGNKADAGVVYFNEIGGAVGGAVVHDDDVGRGGGLGEEGVDAGAEEMLSVEVGDNRYCSCSGGHGFIVALHGCLEKKTAPPAA